MGKQRETNNSNRDAALSVDDNKSIIQFMQTQFDDLKKEFNEVKSLMTVRDEKFEEISGQIADLKSIVAVKDNCIDDLKLEVKALNEKMTKMENLIDEEDAYVRRESLILSGTSVPPATNGEISANVARQVLKDKMKLEINPNDISVCHRLGPKPLNQAVDKRPLVIRFCRRDLKRQILFTKRDNDNQNDTLYTNESLTKKRREIMFVLRKMRNFHRDIVTGCSTLEGKCYAYTKMPTSLPNTRARDRKHVINTQEALAKFCSEYIKKPLDDFLASFERNS